MLNKRFGRGLLDSLISLRPALVASLFALATGGSAFAQSFPTKPITIIYPSALGSGGDVPLRLIIDQLSKGFGQQVLIEPRPSNNGIVGAMAVKRAAPDGHTLLFGWSGMLQLAPFLVANLPYDPDKDFKPITILHSVVPFLGAPTSIPATTVSELVAYAKSRPEGLFFGFTAIGGTSHLLPEMLKAKTGIKLTGVGYKGGADLVPDLLGARIHMYFGSLSQLLPHVASGKLRLLAVGSPQRWEQRSEVPTIGEAGFPGLEWEYWFGLFAPAGTPDSTVRAIQAEFAKALAAPGVKEAYATHGARTGGITPEEFSKKVAEETGRLGALIKGLGIKPQ